MWSGGSSVMIRVADVELVSADAPDDSDAPEVEVKKKAGNV